MSRRRDRGPSPVGRPVPTRGAADPVVSRYRREGTEPEPQLKRGIDWASALSAPRARNELEVTLEAVDEVTLRLEAAAIDPTQELTLSVESTTDAEITLASGRGSLTVSVPAGESTRTVRVCGTAAGPPRLDVTRSDDARVFTGGTDRVDVSVSASKPVRLRDRVPDGWTVVAGDGTERTVDGTTYVEFEPAADGTFTDFVEAPSGVGGTGRDTFGPVEVGSHDGWEPVDGTTDTNVVLGPDVAVGRGTRPQRLAGSPPSVRVTDTEALGDRLFEAYAAAEPVAPLSASHDLSMGDAYAVQAATLARRREAGAEPVGYKLGFTNGTIQAQYGVAEPAHGRLLDDALLDANVVASDELIEPRVEPELAFVMDEPLSGEPAVHEVLAATRAVVPVIEVVDRRMDGELTATDAVADNALAARLRPGAAAADPTATDWGFEAVQLRVGGSLRATGTGADVLGHPAEAVAWLAGRLAERDEHVPAGALVSTGSLTEAVPVEPGDAVTAAFGSLGSVSLRVA